MTGGRQARMQRDLDAALDVRAWYRLLYRDVVPSKRILDIGCGFAFDSLTFVELGAELTLVDNVRLVARERDAPRVPRAGA